MFSNLENIYNFNKIAREAPSPSGRASDSGARGRVRSSLRSPCCILEHDTFTSQKVLEIPRKRWLRPDMTEKMVDWDVKPQPKPKII